jgi:phosphonate degradation associated HDIG domain protein
MTVADEIDAVFAGPGAGAYYGEAVSMLEHALQAAHFARATAAPPALVLAALLHDIGHLLVPVPDELADWTTDAHHEAVGADWLAARFPDEICEPVRLHVPAKRYLCATDPRYRTRLSAASAVTLGLQGGPMTAAEVARFEAEPHHAAAVRLRHCDERAKVAGLLTPRLADYRDLIGEMAARGCERAVSPPGAAATPPRP